MRQKRQITRATADRIDARVAMEKWLAQLDFEAARDSRSRAIALAETVSDSEDRNIVITDIDTLPIP